MKVEGEGCPCHTHGPHPDRPMPMQVIRVMRGILQCPCQPMPLLRRPLKPDGGGWAQVVVRVVALSPAPVCQFLRPSLKSLLSGRLCVGPHIGGQLSCCPASLWQPWRALPSPGRHRCPVQVLPSVQDSLPCHGVHVVVLVAAPAAGGRFPVARPGWGPTTVACRSVPWSPSVCR